MQFAHIFWPSVISILIVIFTLLTLCAMAFSVVCLLGARDFLRQTPTAPDILLPVSILKPLKGCDPNMYESFRSHCLQNYPDFEIIFGVNAAEDDAVPSVERLRREFPQCQIKLLVCSKVLGANGKVSSIVQMLEHARCRHIIINDSDIRVPQNYLREVMREFGGFGSSGNASDAVGKSNKSNFGRQQVGMVTCFYRAVPGRTLWSKLEALGVAADFIPGALAARFLEGRVRFGLGSTLAVDRETLTAIGGMEKLVDYLADDYELADRMVEAGYRVVIPRVAVETFLPDYTFPQYFQHQLRWGRTVRSSRPSGYAGLFVTYGLLWAVLTVIASRAAYWSWLLLGTMILLRVIGLRVSAKSVLGDTVALKNSWLLPLLDLITPAVWLLSIAGSRIVWRGEEFILKAGKLRRP